MPNYNSINTNYGAQIALQTLNATNNALNVSQNRISTGLKIASAKDNGAVWAIAQNSRADISALDAVKDSLQRAQSTVDVANSAGSTISDLLNQMKTKAVAAADSSLNTTARAALASDFTALRDQIIRTVNSASFNGSNLLNSSVANVQALASADGKQRLTVAAQNFNLKAAANNAIFGFSAGITFSSTSQGQASALVATLSTSITNVNAAIAKLGTSSNALQTQLTFVSNLQDTLTTGVGNLVDADVAKESANLNALQTKQQLGLQALSIANSSSTNLLRLFQ
jgi:flagellin